MEIRSPHAPSGSPPPPVPLASEKELPTVTATAADSPPTPPRTPISPRRFISPFQKFLAFFGPGALISVAYIDPDNFQTSVSSGALLQYKLLFMVLVSNIVSVFLQTLSVRLGSVTGMDLAQMNRAYLPRWANVGLWLIAEAAIICTDIGQVIGTAIALNLLNHRIPIIAGCALSIFDTLFILIFYRPDKSLAGIRAFEIFIFAIVAGVTVCFCIILGKVGRKGVTGQVFKGFLPSKEVFSGEGLYESCALLGGTLMPHALYLGSGIVQPRLRAFDFKHSSQSTSPSSESSSLTSYRPSLKAIQSCLSYSIAELCITLFLISTFVNSAILIVAATFLVEDADAASDADLFSLYTLFQTDISQASATLYALALLFSGTSAGIVATMAGQLVCEGAMQWRIAPWKRRLATRSFSIVPSIIVAAAAGKQGLARALNGSNVVLSVCLVFVVAPLAWYTSGGKYMRVRVRAREGVEEEEGEEGWVNLANGWVMKIFAGGAWLLVTVMNVAMWVLMGLGKVDLG